MKKNRTIEYIRQGDTSNIKYMSPFPNGDGGTSNLSNTTYTCRTVVLDTLGGTPLIDKLITDLSADLMYFQVVLLPAETETLSENTYIWVTEIRNDLIIPVFRKEHHIDLSVAPQGLTGAHV